MPSSKANRHYCSLRCTLRYQTLEYTYTNCTWHLIHAYMTRDSVAIYSRCWIYLWWRMEKILHYVIYYRLLYVLVCGAYVAVCLTDCLCLRACARMCMWCWGSIMIYSILTPNRYYNMSHYILFFDFNQFRADDKTSMSLPPPLTTTKTPIPTTTVEIYGIARKTSCVHSETILIIHESMNIFISFSLWWWWEVFFFIRHTSFSFIFCWRLILLCIRRAVTFQNK